MISGVANVVIRDLPDQLAAWLARRAVHDGYSREEWIRLALQEAADRNWSFRPQPPQVVER